MLIETKDMRQKPSQLPKQPLKQRKLQKMTPSLGLREAGILSLLLGFDDKKMTPTEIADIFHIPTEVIQKLQSKITSKRRKKSKPSH